MSNYPEIRFKGFTDAWEQRELGSIYGKIRNAFVGTATPHYVSKNENSYFYLESNNIKNGTINRNTEVFINKEFYERQKDKWLRTGDIVMVQSGHVGHTAVIPEELNNTAAHALIMFQTPKEKINPYFLNAEFQINKMKRQLDIITTGNTIKHILASEMQKFEVRIPKKDEQDKISNLFLKLDQTITLHQRELNLLKKTKKAFVNKLFSKPNENKPKIWFKHGGEDWKRVKLNELLSVSTKKNNNLIYKQTDILAASLGTELIKKYIFFGLKSTADSIKNYRVVKQGDIVYTKSPIKDFPNGLVRSNKSNNGIVPSLYCVYINNSEVYSDFIQFYFEDKYRLDYYLNPLVNVGARNNVNITDKEFLKGNISITSRKKEQLSIIEFLENINRMVIYKEKEIYNLSKVKEAFLQKMFI